MLPFDIKIKDYFEFMDTLVAAYDSLLPYSLTEHLIVRANPWIIDTLEKQTKADLEKAVAGLLFMFNEQEEVILVE